jgi:small subunit ribosomal protein S3Ae
VAVGEQRLQARLRAELRHRIVEVLTEEAKLRTSAEFVHQMIQGELSKLLAHGVKSLYPLKKIEIRRSIVLGTISDEIPTAPAEPAPEGPAPPETPPEPAPEVGASPAA